ncbi:MAG: hypothetical protein ISS36_01510 [Candidatus Aenigmarchaeota archaeon]|nr:hypothetical protein [Candidatus Aenigmarchaeota archaeon]
MYKRKGLVHSMMLAAFALILVYFVLTLLGTRPFWSNYNEAQAKIIAHSISSGVSVLSVSDGSITEELEREWDITISDKEVEVTYQKVKSGKVKLNTDFDLSDMKLEAVKKIVIERTESGIRIREVA